MTMRYRIGEFAALSGVSQKTLRFYHQVGLLRPASVDPRNRYRFYVHQQLKELTSILALRDIGMSLADIRRLNTNPRSASQRREALTDLKRTVEQSIRTATQSLNWINAALKDLDELEPSIPVVVKRRPSMLVASIRSELRSYAEIDFLEQELLSKLPVESIGNLRGVLWHRCADSGCVEGEPFIALKRRVPARNGYEIKELPPATLACAYSGTDDESAEHTYVTIRKWMNVRGYRVCGPKREIPLGQLLEIQFPLESAV